MQVSITISESSRSCFYDISPRTTVTEEGDNRLVTKQKAVKTGDKDVTAVSYKIVPNIVNGKMSAGQRVH